MKTYRYVGWPVFRDEEQERLLVYNKDTKDTIVLNATAALIYDLCTKESPEAIADGIWEGLEQEQQTVTREQIVRDVEKMLDRFVEKGMILEI